MENISSFFLDQRNNNKLLIPKYIFIAFLFFNKISLHLCISLDIKVLPFSEIYNLPLNQINNLRNLSPKIQNIFGSMFKLNYYYTNLYIGDSKEKQGFILDTGSSITTSTCSLCKSCGRHIHRPYSIDSKKNIISCKDPECQMTSSKCEDSKCSFKITYAEGSTLEGIFLNKKIFFDINEKNNIEIPMGCTLKENNLFFKQEVNGIMGLNNNNFNFVEVMYKLGRINRNIFSLCFAQLGGVFTIGDINEKIHKSNISYFQMITEKNKYYKINIKSIFVNNKKLENGSPEENIFILDSGATISYFNNYIFEEILYKMQENCRSFNIPDICGNYKLNSILGHCFYFNSTFQLNEAIKNYWPIINFDIEGFNYKWLPENYYFNITSNDSIGACMGFNRSNKKRNTLGGSWIIGHDFIFDRENKLLGIAEADCYQNKELNMSNGLEVIDLNKIDYYYYMYKISQKVSLMIVIITSFLICGILGFTTILIFRSIKTKKTFINKNFIRRYDILVHNTDTHNIN